MRKKRHTFISTSFKYALIQHLILILEIVPPLTFASKFLSDLFNIFGSIVFIAVTLIPIVTIWIFTLFLMKKAKHNEKKWANIFLILLNCFSITIYFVCSLFFDDIGAIPVFLVAYGMFLNSSVLPLIIINQILEIIEKKQSKTRYGYVSSSETTE